MRDIVLFNNGLGVYADPLLLKKFSKKFKILNKLFYKIPFQIVEGKRFKQWSISCHNKKSGLYVVKSSKENILHIGVAEKCLLKSLHTFFGRVHCDLNYSISVIETNPVRAITMRKQVILELQLLPLNNIYKEILLLQNVDSIISLLDFQEPYLKPTYKKIRTFSRKDWHDRKGVYVIRDRSTQQINYIGMTQDWIYHVAYHHFHHYERHGEYVARRVIYDPDEKEMAFIDVSSLGKQRKHFRLTLLKLEVQLIKILQPSDNLIGVDEIENEMKIVTNLPKQEPTTVEEPPF